MRRIGTAFGVALVLVASLSGAAPSKAKTHGFALSGTVSSVDESQKTFVVRSAAGRETTLVWTGATKISGGTLKPGERVTLRYLDRDRKHIATSVRIATPLAEKRPTPASGQPSAGGPTAQATAPPRIR